VSIGKWEKDKVGGEHRLRVGLVYTRVRKGRVVVYIAYKSGCCRRHGGVGMGCQISIGVTNLLSLKSLSSLSSPIMGVGCPLKKGFVKEGM
jgi:hypothetical protein